MEVDAPVPPPAADAAAAVAPPPPPPSSMPLTEHLANALAQHDYALALRVANDLEIAIQTNQFDPAYGNPQLLLAVQLLLLLVLNDLDNARHLWRRIDSIHKDAPTAEAIQLQQAWGVGKLLWERNIPSAYAAMTGGQWAPELAPLVEALRDRVRRDEFSLLTRAYKRLKLTTLATKLGTTEAEALAEAKQAGWRVDENKGEVEPVPAPPAQGEPVGLPHLEQLAKYISFLEAKSVTSSVA